MNTFLLIVQLLPGIIQAIKAVESAIPLPGKGSEKLALVLGIVEDAVGDISAVAPVLTKVVARLVGALNATGVFAK